jgi:hypothetical protein
MIPKVKTEYQFVEGSGRPFEMNPRYQIERTMLELQKPVVINLGDLNGQTNAKGMPKNFIRKAGRCLATFTKYWTKDEDYDSDDFDIE